MWTLSRPTGTSRATRGAATPARRGAGRHLAKGMGPELTTIDEKPITRTTHAGLAAWVAEVAELTQPRDIHWITGYCPRSGPS